MTENHEAILEALVDILPADAAKPSEDAGSEFGTAVELYGYSDLKANLGPGVLTYQVLGENGENLNWDLESVRVLQTNGEILFSGTVAEMQ